MLFCLVSFVCPSSALPVTFGGPLLLLPPEGFHGKHRSKVELAKCSESKPNSRDSMRCDPGGFWDAVPGVSQVTHENGCDKDALGALALKPGTSDHHGDRTHSCSHVSSGKLVPV